MFKAHRLCVSPNPGLGIITKKKKYSDQGVGFRFQVSGFWVSGLGHGCTLPIKGVRLRVEGGGREREGTYSDVFEFRV